MALPWTLFASGGKKLFQTAAPLRTTRISSPIAIAAGTRQPTSADEDGRVSGVVDINGPRTRWRAEPGGGRQRQVEIGVGRGRPCPARRSKRLPHSGTTFDRRAAEPAGPAGRSCEDGRERARRSRV